MPKKMGAMNLKPSGMPLKLLAVVAGYFLADSINEQLDKVLPKKKDKATGLDVPNQTIGTVAELGVGGLLLLRKKQNYITAIGGGVVAGAGLKRALKQAGVIKGYQSVPVIGRRRMAGYQSVPVIGKVPSQLSGVPNQLTGYRVSGYESQGSGLMGAVGAADAGSGSSRRGVNALLG